MKRRTPTVVIFNMLVLQFWARGVESYHIWPRLHIFEKRLIGGSWSRAHSSGFANPTLNHLTGWKQSNLGCTKREFHYSSVGNLTEPEEKLHPFQECWGTTSFAVNPSEDENIDVILQGLNSPAPQAFFVLDRAIKAGASGDYDSFEFSLKECSYLIKRGWKLVVQKTEFSDATVPGIPWTLLPPDSSDMIASDHMENSSTLMTISAGSSGPNACQLSAQALTIVSNSADAQEPIDDNAIEALVGAMVKRLKLTLGTDIRGRTSADMAFNLCLAGIQNDFLYDALTKISQLEMERVGRRPSRRPKDILHVVEKLAAAGIKGQEVEKVYQMAASSLVEKDQYPETLQLLSIPGRLDLLSPRPLLWLWRYSSRLQKPSLQAYRAKTNTTWWHQFDDPTLPLVIDVGCGLGVSLIGLASHSKSDDYVAAPSDLSSSLHDVDLTKCNYLGGDLNEATVRFANSITSRWNLTDRLHFIQASAEDMLDQMEESNYPGELSLVLIQFPSPWRIKKKGQGNTQLPTGPEDGFMVSPSLMKKISKLLHSNKKSNYLLLQTNCEDVAVALCDRARDIGLVSVSAVHPVTSPAVHGGRLTERTMEWIRLGGERAIGPEWSAKPILPERCSTETEVACEIQGTPVHRCLFNTKEIANNSLSNSST